MFRYKHEYNFVSKGWGWERWIENNREANYCLKEMFLACGKKCSVHYHKNKTETFYIVSGGMTLYLWNNNESYREILLPKHCRSDNDKMYHWEGWKTTYELYPGESITINPLDIHQFYGNEDTLFYEVSTFHEDSDSYRLIKGD